MSLPTEGEDAQVAEALARLPEVSQQDFIRAIHPESSSGARPLLWMADGKRHLCGSGAPIAELAAPFIGKPDVYFTPFAYTGRRRSTETAHGCRALFCDVDVGQGKANATRLEALTATTKTIKIIKLRPHFLVDSGRGFHLYWLLDRTLAKDEWLPLARSLKAALPAVGLEIDPVVTADPARVMRLPGTINSKNGRTARAYRLK
jgi:hypothetical protein